MGIKDSIAAEWPSICVLPKIADFLLFNDCRCILVKMTGLRFAWFYITALLILTSFVASRRHNLKILGLFPHPGISHFHFFHPIMRSLAERGHEVTVVSHFPDKSPPVGYHDISLGGKETLANTVDLQIFENRRIYNHFVEFFMLYEWGKVACNHTIRSDALTRLMRQDNKFDVILMEQFNTDCMMGVAHLLRAPVIALSSCALMPWHYERMGSPIIPSYIPALFLGQSEEMSLPGRLANWISFHVLKLLYDYYSIPAADAILRYKFGQDMPSVGELAKETALMFVNQHFSLSGPKPLPPSVIELGGVHIQKAKPLDVELQRFLDNAEYGVIFISWGSMIRAETMPAAKRDAIVKAVKRLKQRVIWKWENDSLINKPDNMYISKWLPQRDILCHPKVKIFMTHAGLMGSSEAAYCGTPVIATPMYGDQFLNAAAMIHRGMGILLNYEDINENNVIKALKKVMERQYHESAKAVSYAYKHRPQTALETAMWWVEYVAATEGATLLKSHSVHMSRFTYYCLDTYLVLSSVTTLSILSCFVILRKIGLWRKKLKSKSKTH
ncbi:UDP-glucosyltransferase 2-like isoform 2-T2 [Glossina fuscipes fuscipes]